MTGWSEDNDDSLSGGDGNDTLIGNGGADILSGGAGQNLFQISSGDALFGGIFPNKHDSIVDWTAQDRLMFSINGQTIASLATNYIEVTLLDGCWILRQDRRRRADGGGKGLCLRSRSAPMSS